MYLVADQDSAAFHGRRCCRQRRILPAFSAIAVERFAVPRHHQPHRIIVQQRRQPLQARQTRRVLIRRKRLRRNLRHPLPRLIEILLIVETQPAADSHRHPHQRQAQHPCHHRDSHRHQDHEEIRHLQTCANLHPSSLPLLCYDNYTTSPNRHL